ncbi:MAG: hypothetical protein GX494_08010 [Clostridiaceae bacterium]|nr:hypothetical protein [Clostridiaceae bacterium]
MEENVIKAVSYFSAAIFLVVAITMFFVTYTDSDKTIDLVNGKISDKGTVYVAKTADYNENTVAGAFIIGIIKNCPGHDIYIDTEYIPAGTGAVMSEISFVNIEDYYTAQYIYGPDGEIESIRFIKK